MDTGVERRVVSFYYQIHRSTNGWRPGKYYFKCDWKFLCTVELTMQILDLIEKNADLQHDVDRLHNARALGNPKHRKQVVCFQLPSATTFCNIGGRSTTWNSIKLGRMPFLLELSDPNEQRKCKTAPEPFEASWYNEGDVVNLKCTIFSFAGWHIEQCHHYTCDGGSV